MRRGTNSRKRSMATELFTTPTGKIVTVLTGAEATEAVLRMARECAARGGEVAAETVALIEAGKCVPASQALYGFHHNFGD